jgi:hypothetical protein
MRPFDTNKSLQELEGEDWGEPTFNSHLVTECHRLHRVPLRDFTVEDLRIMIGQRFSLEFLIPLALERLHVEPLAEGAFYPGDLLAAVLRAGAGFWQQRPDFRDKVAQIASSAVPRSEDMEDVVDAYAQFRKDQMPVT